MRATRPMFNKAHLAGVLLATLAALAPSLALAAPTEGWKLRYQRSYNGKPVEGQDPIWVFAAKGEALISSEAILAGKAGFPFEQQFIKPAAQELLQLARLSPGEGIATLDRESLPKQSYEFSEETRTILGYRCKKAKTVVNSNTIELWYTTELPAAGAPTVLGHQLGLVLELVRNGNFVISATQIEPFQGLDLAEMAQGGKAEAAPLLDGLSYKDRVWRSRFTTLPVFQDQIVNFSGEDREPREGVTRYANGTVVLKTVQLPVIAPGSQVFVDLLARSNGDAYDRTGSVFVIPLGAAKEPEKGKKTTRNFLDGLQRGVAALPAYQNGNGQTYRGVVATEDYAP
ncbi:MAG: GLPGLI family protein, partial [Paucibacter sp.]|nr:GLPGLI family protein [Roseateles sp.]